MAAVHRYEGTVNQVMGDGIMALFGAPLAHEDHAVRGCYAALAMQAAVKQYAAEVQRSHGVPVQIRVGLHAGKSWSAPSAAISIWITPRWARRPTSPPGWSRWRRLSSADPGRAESGGRVRAGHAAGTHARQGPGSACRRL